MDYNVLSPDDWSIVKIYTKLTFYTSLWDFFLKSYLLAENNSHELFYAVFINILRNYCELTYQQKTTIE